jgi:hypothetical protein
MEPSAAAEGALIAGRRIERDIPHYLDRLEQISLIVLRGDEPVLADLVPADAIVPANREYQSKPITNLSWPAGATAVDFYLRKGDEFRKWRTMERRPPRERQRLEMRLRQVPAQGRARLSATSTEWEALRASPIYLDWLTLQVDPRSFEEIAEELKPRPVIPDRVTTQTHLDAWRTPTGTETLSRVLERFSVTDRASLKALGDALSRKYSVPDPNPPSPNKPAYKYVHAIDYDGRPPADLDAPTLARLDAALGAIAEHLRKICGTRIGAVQSNAPLIAATWAFGRCPETLQDEMLNALKAYFHGKTHPLLAPRQSERVLIHGLGRTVIERTRLTQLLTLLAPKLIRAHVLGALSSILSRPTETPSVLSEQLVGQVATGIVRVLQTLREERSFAVNFKYALLVVGGLLRYREIRPFALVASKSPDAHEIVSQLRMLQDILLRHSDGVAAAEIKKRLLRDYIAALEGTGGQSNLLEDTEGLE